LNQKAFARSDRVADLIREEVAKMFRNDIADPRVKGVTITDVKVTPDLMTARIYYVSREKKAVKLTTEGLNKVKGYVRKELAKRIEMRRVPELEFFYDEIFENGMHFEEVLKGVVKNGQ